MPFSPSLARLVGLIAALLLFPAAAGAADSPRLYREHCAVCHGDNGDGKSHARFGLNPPPRGFTGQEVRRELGRERMIHAVTHGRPGTAMAGWGERLSKDEIAGIVDYIRANFMSPPPVAQGSPGQQIYKQDCAVCHGDHGEGSVWSRNGLDPPPRDFTAPEARRELTRDRMRHAVANGRPGTAMVSYSKRLSAQEIDAVIDYIRADFMKAAGGPATGPAAPASPAPSRADAPVADMSLPFPRGLVGDAARGRLSYAENCRACHGQQGDGQGERSYFIAPPPRNFLAAESLRKLNRPVLFEAISAGVRGTVMPAWSTALSEQEIADVAEYVFSAFVHPAEARKKKGHELAGANPGAAPAVDGTRPRNGRDVYNNFCYFCHGYDGDAKTVATRFLDPPPRDFTGRDSGALSRADMIRAVTRGRPGSAMTSFEPVLSREEIEAVVDFILDSFVERRRPNTRYHIAENGWFDHERYGDAFPFVLGTLPMDADDSGLTPSQRRGKWLFFSACVVCHDRARLIDDRTLWDRRTVSHPRGGYSHRAAAQHGADTVSGATLSARHDVAPVLADPTPQERRGEALFQQNCAFCHASDGTGRNWIGSFLEPHPRDLTSAAARSAMTPERLREIIRRGAPGTTMPAWGSVLDGEQIAAVAAYVEAAFFRAKPRDIVQRPGD